MEFIDDIKLEITTEKYVILGRGSVLDYVDKKLKIINNADFFIETSPNIKEFLNKKVVDIEDFLKANSSHNEYTILICTSLWEKIKQNINPKIIKNFPIVNLYESFKEDIINNNMEITRQYKRMEKFIDTYNLSDSPLEIKEEEDKVLIMVKEWTGSVIPFHQIALGMLLKSKGIKVEFLFNDKSIYGDIILYQGVVEYQNKKIEEILNKVKEKADISYHLLSDVQPSLLDEREYSKLNSSLYYNKVWHSKRVVFENNDELDLLEINWFENASLIKSFLIENHYNKIISFTGAHFDWAILNILAKELDKKVYTCEYARGGYSFSISGATVLQKDVTLFDELNIDNRILDYFIEYSNNHILSNFPVKNMEIEPSVLIPLNIFWDSAAFGEDDIFLYFDEWLLKTIQYILDNHKVKVIVRQHPHESKYQTGKDIEKLLVSKFGNNPMFKFISSTSNKDTYQLMKDAAVILPNTSSVGLEAAMMGKTVIVKNNVYYANSGFVKKAINQESYFSLISSSLNQNSVLSEKDIRKAKIYFGLTMHNSVDSSFGQNENDFINWVEDTFPNVVEYKSVKWLLDAVINNKPLLSNYIKEKTVELIH